MALKLAGEQIGIQGERETILKMNKELNAKSTRGGARERAVESHPIREESSNRAKAEGIEE